MKVRHGKIALLAGSGMFEIGALIVAAIFILPIYYLFVTTFKTPGEAVLYPLRLPEVWSLDNYIRAFDTMNYIRALGNNLAITIFAVAGIVLFAAMAAYALERRKRRYTIAIYGLFLAGMMVPYQMGVLSLFKLVSELGLMNSLMGVILIEIAYGLSFSIFLFKGFIASTVPLELEEAAKIDGCSVGRTFLSVTLPLLTPVIATVAILNVLATWNDFITPLLFLQSRDKGVLLLEVFRNIGQFSVDWTNLFPMLFLSIAPLLVFYLLMQKYIIAGITAGSVKG
ncbi:carbohydrate ABC transporter permease [Paenibacillus sp. GCM10027626]|uniref:carbohydrate ABC transporter permease n=1 Tax=Paenibacillus sp. GCM10027626 TaxID=3273411 RepID=UPI0036441B53